MDLRRALSRNGHVCTIKHRLFSRHVIIDYLEYDTELADDDLARVPLVPKEGQILANSNALNICQLAHHLSKLNDALTKETCTSIGLIILVCDDKRRKL